MKEFLKEVLEELKTLLGSGYYLEIKETNKMSNKVYTGLFVCKTDETVGKVFYLEEDYVKYLKGSLNVKDIVVKLLEEIKRPDEMKTVAKTLLDYHLMKDKIGMILVNYEANQEFLEKRAYIRFLDLAVCFYVKVEADGMNGIAHINREVMELWKADEKCLLEQGMRNMYLEGDTKIIDMEKYIFEKLKLPYPDIEGYERPKLYIFTNQKQYYGASVLLNVEKLHEFATEQDSDLLIYPSSIHEVVVTLKEDCNAGRLYPEDIQRINEDAVDREEQLSNSVYLYSRKEKKVSIYQQGMELSA